MSTGLDRLEDCLQRVYDASRDMGGLVDPEKRSACLRALARLADAWRALEASLPEEDRRDYAERTASLLARIGDDLFYDLGADEEAIAAFALGLSMAPDHVPSLRGIVAAHLQGSDRRPGQALPYAERLAAMDADNEKTVNYIRSLMRGS